MPYIDAGSERLYFERTGEGPPVVLIRGLSRSMRFWEPFLPHLSDHFTLITYDHRGIGRSGLHDGRFSIDDLADDLARLMDAIDLPKAHVFGLSLGGMVAQKLAIRHPDKVSRLALGSTTAGGLKSRFPRVDTLLKLAAYSALLPVDASARAQGPLLMSPTHHQGNPHVAQSWAPHLHQEPPDPKVVFRQALAGALHDAKPDEIAGIDHPTLVITGDADRLINADNSRRLARWIQNSELVELPGKGHDIVAEAPELVGLHLRRFFH